MEIQEEICDRSIQFPVHIKLEQRITIQVTRESIAQITQNSRLTHRLVHVEQANPHPGEVPHRPAQRRLALLDVPAHRDEDGVVVRRRRGVAPAALRLDLSDASHPNASSSGLGGGGSRRWCGFDRLLSPPVTQRRIGPAGYLTPPRHRID